MKNDDLIIKYAHHFSVTECNQLSRDSTPYPMNTNTKMGVGFDYIDTLGYKRFKFRPSPHSMRTEIRTHRMVFYIRHGYLPECVDHANHDTIDNSVGNLRAATHSQNSMNSSSKKGASSKHLGVSWYKPSKKWSVRIKVNCRQRHIGYFISETAAAKAYNTAAAKHFGEFANLNTIPDHK